MPVIGGRNSTNHFSLESKESSCSPKAIAANPAPFVTRFLPLALDSLRASLALGALLLGFHLRGGQFVNVSWCNEHGSDIL